MMVKIQLCKLLSRPHNSDKINQVYDHWLNHTSHMMHAKLSTSVASRARLIINLTSTMTSPDEHLGLGASEPNVL